MFTNYLKIGLRNIRKHKGISFLNVMGLAVGMAVFILIFLYVQFELSYDRYHTNAERIYRVFQEIPYLNSRNATTSAPLAAALVQEFPEIVSATRIEKRGGTVLVTLDEKGFFETDFLWADPQTLDIFSLPFIQGDKRTALSDPFSVIISEQTAYKYFGSENPLGKTLRCNISSNDFELVVTGVFKEIPPNSHFSADFIAPFNTQEKILGNLFRWGNNAFYTYVLLRKDCDPKVLESKFAFTNFTKYSEDYNLHDYHLQALTDIHLRSHLRGEIESNSDIKTVTIFSFIAVLIVGIACMNAINLATARATFRVKEVGLRKVIGAQKSQLVRQFLGESIVLTLFSFLMALFVMLLILPVFRDFIERPIAFQPFHNLALFAMLIILLTLTGLFSGVYPAFLLSSFKPVSLFRGNTSHSMKGLSLRNILVTFQFSISIALIICTLIARNQLHYLKNRDIGYNRNQIIVLPIQNSQLRNNIENVRNELKTNPGILHVSTSSSLLDDVRYKMDATRPAKPDGTSYSFYTIDTDYDFIDLYGINILEGRNFSREFSSDQNGVFLINEKAVKALEWDDPVGQELALLGNRLGIVVGVVKDFHIQSMYQSIEPLAIYLSNNQRYLSIKISSNDIPSTLSSIEKTLKHFVPSYPFQYSFFDDIFERTFKADKKLSSLFRTFTLITVLIACLGLFGLASFSADRRIKEIGIRKVLGASVSGMVILLGREFLKWILVANVIGWPVGYIVMNRWLQNFAYRINVSIDIFILSALSAIVIAAVTVGIKTLKAARSNPVDSLRYE